MTDVQTRPTRSRKKVILTVVAVVLVIGVAAGMALFQPWKIFTRNTVDEALPLAVAAAPVATAAVTAPPLTSPATPADAPVTPEPAAASEPPAEPVPAEPVAAEPVVLASGTFVDGEHATAGTALILQLPDGSRFVRLEGFSTSDGPDVDVALSDQSAGGEWGKYDDGRYVGLGDLKGTDGNQNYPIPADVDLTGLTSVVIWCDRFNVAFGSAAVTL
jgi:hypothetical protein